MITTPPGVTLQRAQGGHSEHHGWPCLVLPGADGTGSANQRAGGVCLPWDELTRTHSSHPRLSDQETVVLGIIVLLIRVRTSVVQMKELKGAGTAG